MPTTQEEAQTIIRICVEEGFDPAKLGKLFHRLNCEVGQKSENSSVKETMAMLDGVAANVRPPVIIYSAGLDTNPPLELLWLGIVIGHFLVWILMYSSCVLATLYQPWYVAFPIISLAVSLLSARTRCPITRWENNIRTKMGWPKINHFSQHYIFKPVARAANALCQQSQRSESR